MTNTIVLALVIESRNHKRYLINNRRQRHKTNHMKRNIPDELKRFDPKEGEEATEEGTNPELATEEEAIEEGVE